MAAMYRLKGLGWLASCAVVAIGFYLVSSQVAAERKRLEQVDARIVAAQRDIRALETEFDVRGNLAQLERWNGDTLSLTVPVASQFVAGEEALAALSPAVRGLTGESAGAVQTAQLIVPSTPSYTTMPANAPVAIAAAPAPAAIVKVAAVATSRTASQSVRLTPAIATASASPVRAMKAVAMLDRSLLSDTTIGDLLSGARAERSRLR